MAGRVKVRPYDRTVGGHDEHVKGYTRETGGRRRPDELPPEEPKEVIETIHVEAHESESKKGRPEKVKSYNYERKEKKFRGGSSELYRKVYNEYRRKGYSKDRAREIAGGVVGTVYREKLAESG